MAYAGLAGANPAPTPQILPDSSDIGGQLGGLLTFRSQSLDPRLRTTVATLAGIALMLGVTHFAH